MAGPTRLHVAGTTAADISPAYDAEWDAESSAVLRRAMSVAGFNEARVGSGFLSFNNVTPGTNGDVIVFQFVSDAIAPGPIAGTFKGQMQALENNAANDARAQIIVRVVSNDGSVVRGTLYGPDTAALSSEFATGTAANRQFPRGGAVSLSPVSAQANDRIVIEVGARTHQSATLRVQLFAGGTNANTDLPENETETGTSYKPWFEFSEDLYTSRLRGARAYILQ